MIVQQEIGEGRLPAGVFKECRANGGSLVCHEITTAFCPDYVWLTCELQIAVGVDILPSRVSYGV